MFLLCSLYFRKLIILFFLTTSTEAASISTIEIDNILMTNEKPLKNVINSLFQSTFVSSLESFKCNNIVEWLIICKRRKRQLQRRNSVIRNRSRPMCVHYHKSFIKNMTFDYVSVISSGASFSFSLSLLLPPMSNIARYLNKHGHKVTSYVFHFDFGCNQTVIFIFNWSQHFVI